MAKSNTSCVTILILHFTAVMKTAYFYFYVVNTGNVLLSTHSQVNNVSS